MSLLLMLSPSSFRRSSRQSFKPQQLVVALNQRRQCFSSVSVPVIDSEELEQQEQEQRPRLQALRERLRDNEPASLSLFGLQKPKRPPHHDKMVLQTQTQQQEEEEDERSSVHKMLQQLRQQNPQFSKGTNILTDSFDRKHSYLRLSLAERCNLRCRYCMPPEGVPLQDADQLLSRSELVHLTSLFVQHGVNKIRLTGGEPLLRKDVVDIVRDLSSLQQQQQLQIGMTTNGLTLERALHPLVDAGLTHVNVSLDTLKPDVFQHLVRRPASQLERVLSSIKAALLVLPRNGRVKINCVVMKGINDDELHDFFQLGQEWNVDVRFIEWMPFSNNGWNQNRFVSYETMKSNILSSSSSSSSSSSFNLTKLQSDNPNDTTKWYTAEPNDSAQKKKSLVQQQQQQQPRIGFITSMSQHFCGTCNRLRLTADGKIKACLFGRSEWSLRDILRDPDCTDEDVERVIHHAVWQKKYSLGGHASAKDIANHSHDNRPMTLIGG